MILDVELMEQNANIDAEFGENVVILNGGAAAEKNPNIHADYFIITEDGVAALKPQYRGANTYTSYPYATSDNGAGNAGSQNSNIPEILYIPEIVNGIVISTLADGIFCCNEAVKKVVLSKIITAIPTHFGRKAKRLNEVKNTEQIISIGDRAFNQTSIVKADFPNLETLGLNAFTQSSKLTYVNIGKVTEITKQQFYSDVRLNCITGTGNVTTIGNDAFYRTFNLRSCHFLKPNSSLTSIGNDAFLASRVLFDWDSLTGCTFGTNATQKQFQPTDFWTAATVTPVYSGMPFVQHQKNPLWANQTIGNTEYIFGNGCVFFSVLAAYCKLNNITINSDTELWELIQELNTQGKLDSFYPSLRAEYVDTFVTGLGLTVENITGPWDTTKLNQLFAALANGKYAIVQFPGSTATTSTSGYFTNHAVFVGGVNDKKELLILDSGTSDEFLNDYVGCIGKISVQNISSSTTDIVACKIISK